MFIENRRVEQLRNRTEFSFMTEDSKCNRLMLFSLEWMSQNLLSKAKIIELVHLKDVLFVCWVFFFFLHFI